MRQYAATTILFLLMFGCGGSDGPARPSVPCTAATDCPTGSVCDTEQNQCRPDDNTGQAGSGGAGGDAGSGGAAGAGGAAGG